jgi:hypothetical protein
MSYVGNSWLCKTGESCSYPQVPIMALYLHIGDPMKTNKTTRSTRPQIMTAVPGFVVSIPDVGWYVTAKGGARHPLDDRRFATRTEAQAALRVFNRGR